MLDPKNKNDGELFEEEVAGLFEGPVDDYDEEDDEDEDGEEGDQ